MSDYTTTAEADAFLNKTIYADDWDFYPHKAGALAQATDIIDTLNLIGTKTSSTQENEFPRNGDTEVPVNIVKATIWIASAFARGADPEADFDASRVKSTAFSSSKTTLEAELEPHVAAGVPSVTAWRLLLPYLNRDKSLCLERG